MFSLITFAVTLLSPATAGDLYKWTDEKGQVHYTTELPPATAKKPQRITADDLGKVNVVPNRPNKDNPDYSTKSTSHKDVVTQIKSSSKSDTPSNQEFQSTTASDAVNSNPKQPSTLIYIDKSIKPQSDQPEIISIIAMGVGVDRDSALKEAYSNAVQQTLGSYIDAETIMQNDTIIHDKILTYSSGFIKNAKIINEIQENDLFKIKIKADVVRQQLLDQAKANNITLIENKTLHAQVMSRAQQEQNAKALLEKALFPFVDTTLFRADLSDKPVLQEQNIESLPAVTIAYPITIHIDELSYKKSIDKLNDILQKIAIKREEIIGDYKKSNYRYFDHDFYSAIYSVESSICSTDFIQIAIWKDSVFSKSKWIRYYIPSNLFTESLIKSMSPTYKRIIEVSLLRDDNDQLIALGRQSAEGIKENTPISDLNPYKIWNDGNNTCLIIRPYFEKENRIYLRVRYNISLKISKKDMEIPIKTKLQVLQVD